MALGKSLTLSGLCFSHRNIEHLDQGSSLLYRIKASFPSSQSLGHAYCLP